MTEPPKDMQAPYYNKNGISTQSNINGKYRKCRDPTCETWISCPYATCFKHWTAMVDKKLTDAKEWT